jgi:hypothetical protein
MIDLNTLVPPNPGVQLTYGLSVNVRGEIAAQGVLANGDTHAFVLIPCDEDEGQAEGCEEANEVRAAEAKNAAGAIDPARAAVVQPNLTPSEMKDRVRAILINRNRRFRGFLPKQCSTLELRLLR